MPGKAREFSECRGNPPRTLHNQTRDWSTNFLVTRRTTSRHSLALGKLC